MIEFTRSWAMPSANTFSIKPIKEFISPYIVEGKVILDPFVRDSPFKSSCISNDLDTSIEADFHLDALDFLKLQPDNSADVVLYDPPYSVRQVSECYKKLDRTVNMETTQASFWGNLKKEVGRVTKKDGIAIAFGWNSGGIGKSNGFTIDKILLVAHGGSHNDTIVTVCRKV